MKMAIPPAAMAALACLLATGVLAQTAAKPPASASQSNLDFWLTQAATGPASRPSPAATAAGPLAGEGANPFAPAGIGRFSREDALPGAVELSDGRLLAGGLYTTRDKPLVVYIDAEKRWRHVPLICVLGIRAVPVGEEMDREWRWKEMGSDEKVYTGRQRPVRRYLWRLSLIDGTQLEGEIDGQPLWIERDGERSLWVLHDRHKGEWGQTQADLVYARHIVISRREMQRVTKLSATRPASPE